MPNGALPAGSLITCAEAGDYTIVAGGADIWGYADQFYYAYSLIPTSGDFTAVVRVRSMEPFATSEPWAKAGIMVRESFEPGSPHVMALRSLQNGAVLQGRDDPNELSWYTPMGGGYGPDDHVWLRLDRQGNTFRCSYAIGGETPPLSWIGASSHQVDMAPDLLVGLATTSHRQGVPIVAAYSDFEVGP